MEKELQPQSLKVTIKLKTKTDVDSCSTATDRMNNVDVTTPIDLNGYNLSSGQATGSQDLLNVGPPPGFENYIRVKEETMRDDSRYQMVVYDPSINGAIANATGQVPLGHQPRRVLPSVGAFTVQCDNCFKWRLIPTQEKYEEIREHIVGQPFLCATAREWRPAISCEDPPDITQDGSRIWALDKPGIAQPPPGWQRVLRIRGEGGTKFADVYYRSPSGKRLRSMIEVQKHLYEHPEYIACGITLEKFSFQIPEPLQENYVRKRSATARTPRGMPGESNVLEVQPLAWASPNLDTKVEFTGAGSSANYFGPEIRPAKKKKTWE